MNFSPSSRYGDAVVGVGLLGKRREVACHVKAHLYRLLSHLAANRVDNNVLLAQFGILVHNMLQEAYHVGVEASAQAAVRRIYHQCHALHRSHLVEHRACIGLRCKERLEDMFQESLVRKHILNHRLRMMQLRGSHHLHRTRNLTCAVDR